MCNFKSVFDGCKFFRTNFHSCLQFFSVFYIISFYSWVFQRRFLNIKKWRNTFLKTKQFHTVIERRQTSKMTVWEISFILAFCTFFIFLKMHSFRIFSGYLKANLKIFPCIEDHCNNYSHHLYLSFSPSRRRFLIASAFFIMSTHFSISGIYKKCINVEGKNSFFNFSFLHSLFRF